MADLLERLHKIATDLQAEIEQEIEEKRKEFKYRLEKGRVIFEQGVRARHEAVRVKITRFLSESELKDFILAPVIYSLIIPIFMLDAFVTIYQWVYFPAYKIPRVKRSDYILSDRKYLGYLNWIEKLNCMYCEYGNGVLAYAREIASRTEWFWCPIKHAQKVKGTHDHYIDFLEYGDGDAYKEKLHTAREKCRACEVGCAAKAPDSVQPSGSN